MSEQMLRDPKTRAHQKRTAKQQNARIILLFMTFVFVGLVQLHFSRISRAIVAQPLLFGVLMQFLVYLYDHASTHTHTQASHSILLKCTLTQPHTNAFNVR